METALAVGLSVLYLAQITYFQQKKMLFTGIFFTAFTGLASFGAVRLLGSYTSFSLPLTPLAVGTSAALGLPGTVLLLFAKLACGI